MQSKYLAQQSIVNSNGAALQRLQALENFRALRAPFDGTVIVRNTDIGDLVVAGSNHILFQVAREDPLRVYVEVPEDFAKEINAGNKAELSFDELPGRLFSAIVVATAHAVNLSNRAQLTELQVSNPADELWPGAYTHVHFHVDNAETVFLSLAIHLSFRGKGRTYGWSRRRERFCFARFRLPRILVLNWRL